MEGDKPPEMELMDRQLPQTEQGIEAAKRELRLARRGATKSLQQLLDKIKELIDSRRSQTVMRIYMEQASKQIHEVKVINDRLLALLDETERRSEESNVKRLEEDLESVRLRLQQHLHEKENDPPSSVASPSLPNPASTCKELTTTEAPDVHAENVKVVKRQQALLSRHEKEMTKFQEELQRKEFEVRLRLQELQFRNEVEKIKLEHENRSEEMKIA